MCKSRPPSYSACVGQASVPEPGAEAGTELGATRSMDPPRQAHSPLAPRRHDVEAHIHFEEGQPTAPTGRTWDRGHSPGRRRQPSPPHRRCRSPSRPRRPPSPPPWKRSPSSKHQPSREQPSHPHQRTRSRSPASRGPAPAAVGTEEAATELKPRHYAVEVLSLGRRSRKIPCLHCGHGPDQAAFFLRQHDHYTPAQTVTFDTGFTGAFAFSQAFIERNGVSFKTTGAPSVRAFDGQDVKVSGHLTASHLLIEMEFDQAISIPAP
ncbi:hypothetical protein Vafri_19834 [Volvox africanus]|uniref:Uncharacterized protein n=1 Tax=Volvox africanus TaxID=51714 RepID=A0A8J4BVV7_9CHLO|nr:hypothetical protein Vafri_19834 [Volvox africanus]